MKKCTLAVLAFVAINAVSEAQQRKLNAADRALAHDVLKQLIETNTSHSVGSTTLAAEAMRKRFLDAGFPAKDMVVMGPDDRHGNLVLPGHTPGEVRHQLETVFAEPKLTVKLATEGISSGEDEVSVTPPPLNKEVFAALHRTAEQMWPGTPVIPEMETGASDSKATMAAGIPSYGFSGMGIDEDDDRAHGKDERLAVESYYAGVEFVYLYLKQLAGK